MSNPAEAATPDLAARMYPSLAEDCVPQPAAPEPPATQAEATEAADELAAREPSLAERMHGEGGVAPDSTEGYQAKLGEVFDHLEQAARFEANEADAAALAEGRREAAAVMHELQVPRDEAGEITRALGEWVNKPAQSEDAAWDRKLTTLAELEREWGGDTQARIQLAQRTAAEAAKRLPWLNDLLRAGAGNDPALIRRFADIGLRQARRARR